VKRLCLISCPPSGFYTLGELSFTLVQFSGGRSNYDTQDLVKQLRQQRVTPHVAQNNTHRSSALDGRTTRHAGYAVSQRKRKRVEEIFGWMKTLGLMRKVRHRGRELVEWMFTYTAAAYNLMRMTKLVGAKA
jgi:hypothetical protein